MVTLCAGSPGQQTGCSLGVFGAVLLESWGSRVPGGSGGVKEPWCAGRLAQNGHQQGRLVTASVTQKVPCGSCHRVPNARRELAFHRYMKKTCRASPFLNIVKNSCRVV